MELYMWRGMENIGDKIAETAELNYHSRKSETSCLIPIQNNHLASPFAINVQWKPELC